MVFNKKKVFIIGNPGANIGDEAAMKGIIYGLNKYVNNIDLYVSYSGYMDCKTIESYVTKFYNDNDFFSTKGIINYFLSYFFSNKKCEAMNILQNSDLILIAPGGCGIHKYNKIHWFKLLLFMLIIRKKFVFYAPSMGPFVWWQKYLLKYFIKRVKLITLRDSTSKKFIEKLGVKSDQFYVTSDSALQINIKTNFNRIKPQKFNLAVTPINLNRFKNFTNISNKHTELTLIISNLINWLYNNNYLKSITFIPHVSDEKEKQTIKEILSRLEIPQNIIYLEKLKDAESTIKDYEKYDLCIAARHHAGAFALKMGVPTLCFGYEHKATGFFKQCNLENYVLSVEKLNYENSINTLKMLIKNYNKIVNILQEKMPTMENNALKNSIFIKDIL